MAIANGQQMKVCDLTQFYSPLSGGVKRYVHEKIAYIQSATSDEHVLVVPGPKTECVTSERSRIYFIHSPLISRTSHYRALINLRAIEQILERERPDLIESGDPYQVAWKAIASVVPTFALRRPAGEGKKYQFAFPCFCPVERERAPRFSSSRYWRRARAWRSRRAASALPECHLDAVLHGLG